MTEIFEEIRRELERLRRRILEEIERTQALFSRPGWTPEGMLEPLYNVYEYPDRYVVLLDLAGADTGTIDVKVVDDVLIIESRLERKISYGDLHGTVVGREVTFHGYRQVIRLPPDADPARMKVNVRRNKLVEVIIPKKGACL